MTDYDHFKENPGFILWNVANVTRPDEKTWNLELIGREEEWIANVQIQKKTMAETLDGVLSLDSTNKKPYTAGEDYGITIVSRDLVYHTEVEIQNVSKEYNETCLKRYTDAGLENNEIYKMAKGDYENGRAQYEAWKVLPQTPLENGINTYHEEATKRKCYFGLPHIVYMHLVGQLCTNI